jgi:hypothetical protein
VNPVEVEFQERSATGRTVSLPLAHLSIEVGHLYMEDFEAGPGRLDEMFGRIAPWVQTAERECAAAIHPKPARISTCFLIDDYFTTLSTPRDILPMVLNSAAAAGLHIDYVAREAACATIRDLALAELVAARVVEDPPPGTDGSRPPVRDSGWLSNGSRSPGRSLDEAMSTEIDWEPPSENAANRHSIFVDVELWDDHSGPRQWSCAFLAAVWQLLRLGVLRDMGNAVAVPERCDPPFPEQWTDLPAVAQVNPRATSFTAYRTFSALPNRFMPTELAVRTILSQIAVEHNVAAQLAKRADGEDLFLPAELVDRIEYAFVGKQWR